MAFWDEETGFDIRDRKHPDFANAGRNMGGTPSPRNPPATVVSVGGQTRYVCPFGCGKKFDSMIARELHIATDHDREAA